jgi:hypothetical protein
MASIPTDRLPGAARGGIEITVAVRDLQVKAAPLPLREEARDRAPATGPVGSGAPSSARRRTRPESRNAPS